MNSSLGGFWSNVARYAQPYAISVVLFTLLATTATPFREQALRAQEPSGTIKEITPSVRGLTLTSGDTVRLSINVVFLEDARDQNLARIANISWSASGGELNVGDDEIFATYIAPVEPGTYTVTATAGPACIGDADDCTATIPVTIRRVTEPVIHDLLPELPEIPTMISDSNGAQHKVFTPQDGGKFTGADFSVIAETGTIRNGEYIGVRMVEDGSASNAGMSHHRYNLSGSQYKISVVDAGGATLSSYALQGTVNVCIPVADELRPSISNVTVVTKNSDGTLTAMSSSVSIIESSIIACGTIDTLPATIAAGVPGTPPPLLAPATQLPRTGGAAPSSTAVLAWAILIGVALLATGMFAVSRRRRNN